MKKKSMKIFKMLIFMLVTSLGFAVEIMDNVSLDEVKEKLNNKQVLVAAKKPNGKLVVCVPDRKDTSNEALYEEAEKCLEGFKSNGVKTPFHFYVSENLDPVRHYYYNKSGAYYYSEKLQGVTAVHYTMVFY